MPSQNTNVPKEESHICSNLDVNIGILLCDSIYSLYSLTKKFLHDFIYSHIDLAVYRALIYLRLVHTPAGEIIKHRMVSRGYQKSQY